VPKCPISCGECCDQWVHIEVLWHDNRHLDMDDLCPNLGSDGCRLPRSHRPRACREHLCSRAKQVLPHTAN
jgi:Fe-S-cluster containining protein